MHCSTSFAGLPVLPLSVHAEAHRPPAPVLRVGATIGRPLALYDHVCSIWGQCWRPPRPFTHKPASALSVGVGCSSIRLEKEGVQIKERMRLLTPTPRSFQNRRLLTPVGLEQVYQCPGLCLGSSAFVSWNVPMRQSGAAGAWQPASRLHLWRQGRARDSWKQLTMIISIFRCDD